jgi:acyl-CoA thioesterase-1
MLKMVRARTAAALLVLGAASACSFGNVQCGLPKEDPSPQTQAPSAAAPSGGRTAANATPEIVFLGDSLTAGLGLLSDQAFPALIEEKFGAEGYVVEAVNAGVSADTTAGGRRRVDQLLGPSTRILVVALGGNDALRGLTVMDTHDNLAAIISAALDKNVGVLLCGMEGPTNLGDDYRAAFRDVYLQLTREFRGRISVVTFLLQGVAGIPELNQADGIHPNARGARVVADLLYPKLRTMIDQSGG